MSTDLLDRGVAKGFSIDKPLDHTPSTFASAGYRPKKRLISKQEKSNLPSVEDRALIMGLSPEIDEIMDAGFPSYMLYVVDNDPDIQSRLSKSLYSHIPKYYGEVANAINHAEGRFSYVHLDYMCMFKPESSAKALRNLCAKLSSNVRIRVSYDTSNRGRTGKAGRHSTYRKYCRDIYDKLAISWPNLAREDIREKILRHETEPALCAWLTIAEQAFVRGFFPANKPTVINYSDTTKMQTAWVDLMRLEISKETAKDLVVSGMLLMMSALNNPQQAPVL